MRNKIKKLLFLIFLIVPMLPNLTKAETYTLVSDVQTATLSADKVELAVQENQGPELYEWIYDPYTDMETYNYFMILNDEDYETISQIINDDPEGYPVFKPMLDDVESFDTSKGKYHVLGCVKYQLKAYYSTLEEIITSDIFFHTMTGSGLAYLNTPEGYEITSKEGFSEHDGNLYASLDTISEETQDVVYTKTSDITPSYSNDESFDFSERDSTQEIEPLMVVFIILLTVVIIGITLIIVILIIKKKNDNSRDKGAPYPGGVPPQGYTQSTNQTAEGYNNEFNQNQPLESGQFPPQDQSNDQNQNPFNQN